MRTVDRVLALVLGLAGLALGIVVVAEVVQGLLGRPGHLLVPYEGVATWLREHTWGSGAVLTISIVVGVVGLLLLVLEIKPRRKTLLVVQGGDDEVVTAISRTGVGRALEQSVAGLPGVDSTRSTVTGRKATLVVRTPLRHSAELDAQVRERAGTALAGLGLASAPSLSIDLQEVSA